MKKQTLVIWLLGMLIVALLLFGCATQPNFKPLPPKKIVPEHWAYKSVTEKDYKDNDDEC